MPHRILVADPYDAMRVRVRSLLVEAGWQVIAEAADGEEAVKKAKELMPDLAILDMRMPVKSGLEAATEILKHSPATKVVIFTVHEGEEIKREVLRAGAHGYALKSASGAELLAEIKRVLDEAR